MSDIEKLHRIGWELPATITCAGCGAKGPVSIDQYEAFGKRMAPLLPAGWLRRDRAFVSTQYACSVECALTASAEEMREMGLDTEAGTAVVVERKS